jgi:hypothetical protein
VLEHNADPTGVGDSASAFQAAVNASRHVIVPPGTYKIGSVVTLPDGTFVEGSGLGGVSLISPSLSARSFFTTGDWCRIAGFRFGASGSLPGLGSGGAESSGGAAVTIAGNRGWLEHLEFRNVYNCVVIAPGAVDGAVYVLNDLVGNDYAGSALQCNSTGNLIGDVFVTNFSFYTGPLNTTGTNVLLSGYVEAFSMMQADVIGGQYALRTTGGGQGHGVGPCFNKFSTVYFDSATAGVLLDNAVGAWLTNCWFSCRPGSGCTVQNSNDVSFNQCNFVNNGTHGLLVASTAARVRVTGGSSMANNYSATGDGYHFAAGASDFIVQGCTASNTGMNIGGNQRYGICVESGASDRYIIQGNLVSGNATGGVSDGGAGSNKLVANNY